jgi:hypothetical protein
MKKSFGASVLKIMASTLNWLTSSSLRAFVSIFILAFWIRASGDVLYILPSPERELGAIARALVDKGQFANPYILETGPTAHLPPIPPIIVALIYYTLGRTWQAGYVFWGFIFMTSSLIYALLPWITDRLGAGRQAGFVGGLMGAFIVELEQPTHGEGLAAIMLGLMLMTFLRRWNNGQSSVTAAFLLGLWSGISFHIQPALLPVFLGCLVFEIGWHKAKRKTATISMLVLGVVLACVPWAWRNYTVFHDFFFIRSNLGLELRMGNSPGVAATFEEMDRAGYRYKHPRATIEEARKVQQLGEMEYMREALNESLAWIQDNPLEFFKLTFMRFIHFWFGLLTPSSTSAFVAALTILAILGIRRIFPSLTLPQRIILLTPMLTYPLIYYLVPFMPRYRTPIDWMLFLLAGVEIWRWFDSQKMKLGNPFFHKGVCLV